MTDTAAQFAARIARWEAKKVRENPSNHNEITVEFARRYGSAFDPAPWCAEGVSVIGTEGGVLPESCVSAGAKDLTERLTRHGLGRTLTTVHFPGVISFNYGHGHVGFLLGLTADYNYGYTFECNTGSGNAGSQRDGDGAYFRKRFLGGDQVHQVCDLVFAASPVAPPKGVSQRPYLRLTNPLMVGQAVLNVRHALAVAGNNINTTDPRYTSDLATLVNLFNTRHHVADEHGRPARGVTPATWSALSALVRH